MFRLILYLLLAVILISLLRGIIGTIVRVFSVFVQASGGHASPRRNAAGPLTGELKRDPVCGTFIATASSVKLGEGANAVHFCSAECRDKYVMAARP